MVEGLCRGLLRDAAEAEDAAQQTFLLAYRSLLRGAEPREPAAWLATIARNECVARIEERTRRPLPVAATDDAALPDALAEALGRADLRALWQAISALPPKQRSAFLMREFGGLRYDELALALGVSEPAVESLLFRARRHLRAALQPVHGASAIWESLARIFAGAGPTAAVKVGAATVGVAVLAGGAVEVVPSHHPIHEPRVLVHRPAVPRAPLPVYVASAPAVSRAALVVARKPQPERDTEPRRAEGREPEREQPAAEPSDDAVVSAELDLGDRPDASGDSR